MLLLPLLPLLPSPPPLLPLSPPPLWPPPLRCHTATDAAHGMATSRYITHCHCITPPANAVSCITLAAATIIAIPTTAITTAIVATTKAPRHDGRSLGMVISCHWRFWRHRNAKQCHAEGVGQGPPLLLWGGGRVITVFTCCHMHTVLIKYK